MRLAVASGLAGVTASGFAPRPTPRSPSCKRAPAIASAYALCGEGHFEPMTGIAGLNDLTLRPGMVDRLIAPERRRDPAWA